MQVVRQCHTISSRGLIIATLLLVSYVIIALSSTPVIAQDSSTPTVAPTQSPTPTATSTAPALPTAVENGRTIAADMIVIYDLADPMANGKLPGPAPTPGPTTEPSTSLPPSITLVEESCRLDPTDRGRSCPEAYRLIKIEEAEQTDRVRTGLYRVTVSESARVTETAPLPAINYTDVVNGVEAIRESHCATPAHVLTAGNHFASGGNHFASGGNHFASGMDKSNSLAHDFSHPTWLPDIELEYHYQWAFDMIGRDQKSFVWQDDIPIVFVDVFDPNFARVSGLTYVYSTTIPLPDVTGEGDDMTRHGNIAYGAFRSVATEAQSAWAVPAFNAEGAALNAGIVEGVTKAVRILKPLLESADAPEGAIVNMSFGITDRAIDDCTRQALENLFAYGRELGIFFVASTGNEQGVTEYPASSDHVFDVAAVKPNGDLTDYSNAGTYLAPGGVDGAELIVRIPAPAEILAEGQTETTGDPHWASGYDYFRVTGTSFAAPQVSGLIANILSTHIRGLLNEPVNMTKELAVISNKNCGVMGLNRGVSKNCPRKPNGQTQTNQPPTVRQPGQILCHTNQPCAVPIRAVDPDGDSLTYTRMVPAIGLSLGRTTGLISGVPTIAGSHSIHLWVSDGVNPAVPVSVLLDVNGTPVINQLPTRSSSEGAYVNVGFAANDLEYEQITYEANNLPPGVSIHFGSVTFQFDPNGYPIYTRTGSLRGYPTAAGIYNVTLTATDVRGGSSAITFQWTVALPRNDRSSITNDWGQNQGGTTTLPDANPSQLYLPLINQ